MEPYVRPFLLILPIARASRDEGKTLVRSEFECGSAFTILKLRSNRLAPPTDHKAKSESGCVRESLHTFLTRRGVFDGAKPKIPPFVELGILGDPPDFL